MVGVFLWSYVLYYSPPVKKFLRGVDRPVR